MTMHVTRIVDRVLLNKEGSSRQAWHIVLEMPFHFPKFKPGDSVGIYPKNIEEEVYFLLHYFGLREDSPIVDKKGVVQAASTWLRERAEIGRVTSSLLKAVTQRSFSLSDRTRLSLPFAGRA